MKVFNWLENRILIKEAVDQKLINKSVCFAGFLRRIRKLGKLSFVILADTSGEIQLIFNENLANEINQITKESVIAIEGNFNYRKDQNYQQEFGKYEVLVKNFIVVNDAKKLTPFVIDQIIDANEDTKLKYRYLELRSDLSKNIKNRSRILNYFREFLLSKNFIEIDTPILGRSTPEGARDYLVPVRTKQNASGFALPQSPQMYKQLLMVGGIEKYFQIAKNFRDEDLRADRQPEFSQLDIEIAYSNTSTFLKTIESLFVYVWKKFFNKKLLTPFLQMSYYDAIQKYGTDKPDLRFNLTINSYNDFPKTKWNQNQSSDFKIKSMFLEKIDLTWKKIDEIKTFLKTKYQIQYVLIGSQIKGIKKGNLFSEELNTWTQNQFIKFKADGTLLVFGGNENNLLTGLGVVRKNLAESFQLYDPNEYKFLWIIDWPLFEFNNEKNNWDAAHNPFTAPKNNLLEKIFKEPKKALANAYDLVLNGMELGSGAQRITDANLQQKMFEFLGLNLNDIDNTFGWFIQAYQYGSPPHQGIGLGLDRILKLMLKTNTIRDVIAFPKNNQGIDVLQATPAPFNELQLNILNLTNIKK